MPAILLVAFGFSHAFGNLPSIHTLTADSVPTCTHCVCVCVCVCARARMRVYMKAFQLDLSQCKLAFGCVMHACDWQTFWRWFVCLLSRLSSTREWRAIGRSNCLITAVVRDLAVFEMILAGYYHIARSYCVWWVHVFAAQGDGVRAKLADLAARWGMWEHVGHLTVTPSPERTRIMAVPASSLG